MSDNKALFDIFQLFFDDKPSTFEIIDTSRNETDFREVIIAEFDTGEKAVVKLADNDFTFSDKIKMWQRTAQEYLKLGYYCPKIFTDKNGCFPTVTYKDRRCIAYAEEYASYRPAEYYPENGKDKIPSEKYIDDAWIMTAKVASKYFSYTDYPSGYCLFDKFCPSDKNDEVLDIAIEWKDYADTLSAEFQPQIQRIWKLWTANRNALEPIYGELPTSVFQADLNPTNVLVDESGNFVGVYDFNLCGKEVFLNYLFRETFCGGFQKELDEILNRLRLVSKYYHFSELEKQIALMLYRCLKPLFYYRAEELKEFKDDAEAIHKFLDETEDFLTRNIDFEAYMN